MAEKVKLFANGVEISPETVMPQVKSTDGTTNVDEVLAQLVQRVSDLEQSQNTSNTVRLQSRYSTGSNAGGEYWDVVIDDWKDEYADMEKYRLVFMRKRSREGGTRWAIPMYYELHPHIEDGAHPENRLNQTCIIPSKRLRVMQYTGGKYVSPFDPFMVDAITFIKGEDENKVLRNITTGAWGSRVTMYIGIALFKYTGKRQFGWERISNIAGLKASVGRRKSVEGADLNPQLMTFHEV